MTTRRDGTPGQLTLLPLHGNVDKRPRPLDRDVSLIGRARGSELRLDAVEISTLHCVIYRTPEGYRVRDCGSRTGTRVNGDAVRNSVLHDGDVLQLGPFSFEVRIPAALLPENPPLDPLRVAHWQASRRHLASLALRLRRRLCERPTETGTAPDEHKVHQLRERIRSYEQRHTQMEEAERELETERQTLRREREALAQRVQQVEAEMAARLERTEQEVRQRWAEFQQRCQVDETRALEQAERLLAAPPSPPRAAIAEDLDSRIQELAQQEQQVQRRHQELETMMQEWKAEQGQARVNLDQQRAALAQQEATLKAQRTEVARMLGELKRLQQELRQQPSPDLKALEHENVELRHMLAECEQRLASASSGPEPGEARAENELLRQLLQQKDEVIAQLQEHRPVDNAFADVAALEKDLHQFKAENDLLRQLLDEKESAPPSQPAPAPRTADDLESYETELNQFRQQLEADRAKLQEELEQLRQRNEELDEATRDMEMQLSRERAELARERTRVERMREDLRVDLERTQRESSVRDSLAPVQRLREEMQRRPNGAAK